MNVRVPGWGTNRRARHADFSIAPAGTTPQESAGPRATPHTAACPGGAQPRAESTIGAWCNSSGRMKKWFSLETSSPQATGRASGRVTPTSPSLPPCCVRPPSTPSRVGATASATSPARPTTSHHFTQVTRGAPRRVGTIEQCIEAHDERGTHICPFERPSRLVVKWSTRRLEQLSDRALDYAKTHDPRHDTPSWGARSRTSQSKEQNRASLRRHL